MFCRPSLFMATFAFIDFLFMFYIFCGHFVFGTGFDKFVTFIIFVTSYYLSTKTYRWFKKMFSEDWSL